MPDLLIELFSEEIPARMQARASADLRRLVTDGLVAAGLTYASAGAFATPRRLTLAVEGLTAVSQPVREEKKGPSLDANPQSIAGYLRGLGMEAPTSWYMEKIDALKRGEVIAGEHTTVFVQEFKGKKTVFAASEFPGRPAAVLVAEVLEATIRAFPWPKSMRWGNGTLRWVRPLKSILCLLTDEGGATVVPMSVDGIASGDTTEGHRFLAPGRFAVRSFDDYAIRLRRAYVMLDPAEREAAIWQGATNLGFAAGLQVVPDAGLLSEVAGLVEWPVPLMGCIDQAFLGLPPEVLQTSMRAHQKFFSVLNPGTGRIEGFVTVANTETADHGQTILKGNQKVLSARLSDARFFWENDLRVAKAGMGEWTEGLASVTFHNKLGSQADRVDRIAALAREIAPMVGADPDLAFQAAQVAKADLRSAMVGEFPELQGLMGMYYARAAGLPEAVALAARDHYSPLGPSDAVPSDPVSVAVALADKIDTLAGFWAIDEKPTGSKDPFALRRAALGVIRLVVGNGVRVGLKETLFVGGDLHYQQFQSEAADEIRSDDDKIALSLGIASRDLEKARDLIRSRLPRRETKSKLTILLETRLEDIKDPDEDLLAFLHDRLKVTLRDQGITHDIIDACLAMPGNDDLTLVVKRAQALSETLKTDDGANLIQGFKRANNIWTQAMEKDGYQDSDAFKKAIEILNEAENKDGVEYSYGPDPKFAETPEERALFAALDEADATIAPAMKAEDFATAMQAMATLRAPIDAFFTAVQVNTDNPVIRRNRLNLLHRIRTICGQVADLTRLDG